MNLEDGFLRWESKTLTSKYFLNDCNKVNHFTSLVFIYHV